MLNKILKRIGVSLTAVLLLLTGIYGFIAVSVNQRINNKYRFSVSQIKVASDSVSVLRGKHLVAIKGCNDCHGDHLEGKIMVDNFPLGRLCASNLTKGKGGLPAEYTTTNWLMALQHGIDAKGTPLILMPSHETALLTRDDLSAIIAYCNTLPARNHVLPENNVGPVAKVMTFLGKMPLLSVEKIDHKSSGLIKVTDTTEGIALGKYLAVSCSGCHRQNFLGGPPLAPGFPEVPNITSSGNPGQWSKEQFIQTLRTGKTPGGHQMRTEDMPWKMTAQYTDKELASLFQFLKTLK
jgi:mono/diheme cytochrome c family protein